MHDRRQAEFCPILHGKTTQVMHRVIFFLLCFFQVSLFSQTLSGTVAEPSGASAAFATLRLRSGPTAFF